MRRRGTEVGVEQDRQVAGGGPSGEVVQPHHVVEMPIAEDDRLERVGRDGQPVQVADQTVRRDPGVEQHSALSPCYLDLDQRRESVLGTQEVHRLAALGELPGITGISPAVPTGPQRRTRPSSGSNTSEELSTTVVMWTPSTGPA